MRTQTVFLRNAEKNINEKKEKRQMSKKTRIQVFKKEIKTRFDVFLV